MQRTNLNDLVAFLTVARERSFTKAAAKLAISQSTLSHLIRDLETRLGIRLLTRTTRSVAPTEAGERLLAKVGPRLDEVELELASLSELRDRPSGSIRITSTDYATDAILWPKLLPLLRKYPEIKIEIITDYGLTDIVTHDCINLRLPTHGGLYAWEFEKGSRELRVRVEGQLIFNGTAQMLNAALAGFGLAYVPDDLVQPYLAKLRLKRVLEDWCQPYSGYHLYYPSRRQPSAAFALLVDALRYRN